MSTNTYQIKGMHCASCANIIERTLKKQEGVQEVSVNYGTEKANIAFDPAQTNINELSKHIEPLGYSIVAPTAEEMGMSADEHAAHLGLNQSKKEKLAELADLKIKIISAIPLAIFSIFVMAWEILAQFNYLAKPPAVWMEFFHHLLAVMATYVLFVVGKPYLLGLYRFLRYGKANMDSLIGLGTSVAYVYSFIVTAFEESLRPYINVEYNYYDVTIVIITFIALGKYLETRSKIKTGDAIEKLLNLQVKTALVIRDGQEQEVSSDQVQHGDLILVKPGMKVPVDGLISEGHSNIDESMLTGEPMPVSKNRGDKVAAGTINTTGSFTMKATGVGAETLLAHIIKMVEEAQGSKAPIQRLADQISAVFVPIVLVISFISLGLWLAVGTGYIGFSQALSFGLTSFVGVLIIACPCALGLATPTAIIVGVGKGASNGVLIKNAEILEKLHKVKILVVDKTGTLTVGKPELISLETFSPLNKDKALQILASLEKNSEHPLGECIVQAAAAKKINLSKVEDFKNLPGQGVSGKINGQIYYVGGPNLIESFAHRAIAPWAIKLPVKSSGSEINGHTVVYLANDSKILAQANIGDQLKPEAKAAIKKLHHSGIKVIMATGDNQSAAQNIAQQLGIDDVLAQVMPADKLAKIKELQSKGQVVAMAGDGVNDAPALAQADVGLAMSTGTDVSIETSDVTLLHGDISKIAQAIKLSRSTMATIKQNLFWAFIYNVVGIPIASGVFYPFFGWVLSPVLAGMAMALSSVSVVTNSLRLKTKKL